MTSSPRSPRFLVELIRGPEGPAPPCCRGSPLVLAVAGLGGLAYPMATNVVQQPHPTAAGRLVADTGAAAAYRAGTVGVGHGPDPAPDPRRRHRT